MTLDNLIALVTSGFTKEEILTMSGTATQRAPQPQPQPQPQTQAQGVQGYTQQFPQMLPQAQPQTQAYPQIGEQSDVLNALKSLTSAVQSNNINLMQNAVPKQVTTEDAIASIINPQNYEGLQEVKNNDEYIKFRSDQHSAE